MSIKTTVSEFIKYLKKNKLSTARLITVLKKVEEYDYFIEDISKKEFDLFVGAGKKTSAEFFELKTEYLEKQDKKNGYDKMTHKELIERIKELENMLHQEKKRFKTVVENTEYELIRTTEKLKRIVERCGG